MYICISLCESDAFIEAYRKHRDETPRDAGAVWCEICNTIGRLGSWMRAARVLVRSARAKPQALENFRVECLQPPKLEDSSFGDHRTTLHGVLTRMLPKDKGRVLRAKELLRWHSLDSKLRRYSSKRPAELRSDLGCTQK
jgi:hypothetical protein